jgi:hypothetical protein
VSDDVTDVGAVLTDKIVKARKDHKCVECRKTINKGEMYRYEVIKNDDLNVFKTCADCNSVREHLVCFFYYGEIWWLIEENISEYGDQQPWSKIGRLTPVARERVCKIIEDSWRDDEKVIK